MRRIHVCYLVIDHVYFLFTLFSCIVHLHCSFTSLIFIVHVHPSLTSFVHLRRSFTSLIFIVHVHPSYTSFVHLRRSFTSFIFIVHVQRASCKYNSTFIGTTAIGCMEVLEGSETDLQAALVVEGPLSAAIDASHPTFQFYR